MAKKLFIVESPGKIKSIANYLDQSFPGVFVVKASVGHIRDLDPDRVAIDFHTFKPAYKIMADKERIVSGLKKIAATCDEVILATDLDREGEAIAWHLAQVLRLKNPKRIVYNEINQKAIEAALASPQTINMSKVASQEARRFIDRIVGYTVSPILNRKIKSEKSLSGGRVQSVVLLLIKARCDEIENFKPVDHYAVHALFDGPNNISWKATWVSDKFKNDDGYLVDKNIASRIASEVLQTPEFTVEDVIQKEVKNKPPKPFTTSLLQQAAANRLKLPIQKTMQLAQSLYEAGLITYMRTDTSNLSDEAIESIREFLNDYQQKSGRTGLLPNAPNRWKSADGAQEAHEAIRPTDIFNDGKDISDPLQQQLYRLVRARTISSQMSHEVVAKTSIMMYNSSGQKFKATGSVQIFDGWKSIFNDDTEDDTPKNGAEEENAKLPAINAGYELKSIDVNVAAMATKPPAYYTQASLVNELEKKGVGRPSTYASIITVNLDRGYVVTEKRSSREIFKVTPLGSDVCSMLLSSFTFMDAGYTSRLEQALDALAKGEAGFKGIMQSFLGTYEKDFNKFCSQSGMTGVGLYDFSDDVTKSTVELKKLNRPDGAVECPKCKIGYLRSVNGKFGVFWACSENSAKKSCKAMYSDHSGQPMLESYSCPLCKKDLRLRFESGKYLWSCRDYKSCGYSVADDDGKPKS